MAAPAGAWPPPAGEGCQSYRVQSVPARRMLCRFTPWHGRRAAAETYRPALGIWGTLPRTPAASSLVVVNSQFWGHPVPGSALQASGPPGGQGP